MSGLDINFSGHVSEQLDHLLALVRDHDLTDGTKDAPGDLLVGWEPRGWWLSVVCPGHMAFERDSAEDLAALVQAAVEHYGSETALFDSGKGCRLPHPIQQYEGSR